MSAKGIGTIDSEVNRPSHAGALPDYEDLRSAETPGRISRAASWRHRPSRRAVHHSHSPFAPGAPGVAVEDGVRARLVRARPPPTRPSRVAMHRPGARALARRPRARVGIVHRHDAPVHLVLGRRPHPYAGFVPPEVLPEVIVKMPSPGALDEVDERVWVPRPRTCRFAPCS